MSINTTSLIFSEEKGRDLRVLNFWIERETEEEEEGDEKAEKKPNSLE